MPKSEYYSHLNVDYDDDDDDNDNVTCVAI